MDYVASAWYFGAGGYSTSAWYDVIVYHCVSVQLRFGTCLFFLSHICGFVVIRIPYAFCCVFGRAALHSKFTQTFRIRGLTNPQDIAPRHKVDVPAGVGISF